MCAPQAAAALKEEGNKLHQAGNFNAAISKYQRALDSLAGAQFPPFPRRAHGPSSRQRAAAGGPRRNVSGKALKHWAISSLPLMPKSVCSKPQAASLAARDL